MTPEELYRLECEKRHKRLPTPKELHGLIRDNVRYAAKCPKCKSEHLVINQRKRRRRATKPRGQLKQAKAQCADCGYVWRSSAATRSWYRMPNVISGGDMSRR
jgi:predicted Zn-ribbon and HTH transcriptional regulator